MKSNTQLSTYASLPPQDLKAEAAILADLLSGSQWQDEIFDLLKQEEIFYDSKNRVIFASMLRLRAANRQLDLITVADDLSKHENLEQIGGHLELVERLNNRMLGMPPKHHALIIVEKWMQRGLIRIGSEIVKLAHDGLDAFEVIDWAEAGMQAIQDALSLDKDYTPYDVLPEVFGDIERAKELQGRLSGIDTGIASLNEATNGWQPCEHIVIAARPACGKTAFALNMLLNAALKGTPVYIHSLEMSRKALVRRCLAILSGVDLKKMKNGRVSPEDELVMQAVRPVFEKLPITIDDRSAVTMSQIFYKARKLKRKGRCGMVIIDYLQLCRPKDSKQQRHLQVAEMSWTAKIMAKELEIPVLDLCQLSRESEKTGRRPVKADLRESGSIEQDADVIAFLHHEKDENTGEIKNLFIIAKNRDGEEGVHNLKFIGATQKWTDQEDKENFTRAAFNPYAGMPGRETKFNYDDTPF